MVTLAPGRGGTWPSRCSADLQAFKAEHAADGRGTRASTVNHPQGDAARRHAVALRGRRSSSATRCSTRAASGSASRTRHSGSIRRRARRRAARPVHRRRHRRPTTATSRSTSRSTARRSSYAASRCSSCCSAFGIKSQALPQPAPAGRRHRASCRTARAATREYHGRSRCTACASAARRASCSSARSASSPAAPRREQLARAQPRGGRLRGPLRSTASQSLELPRRRSRSTT